MVTSFTETEKQMVSVERAVQYIEDVIPEHSPRGSVSFKSIFPKKETALLFVWLLASLASPGLDVNIVLRLRLLKQTQSCSIQKEESLC